MTELALFELLSLECRVDPNGTVRYCNRNGRLHRVYGPAIECPSRYRAWYQDGLLHRLDGPAVEYADVGCAWYQNGQRHRVDGPAVEYADVGCAWFINGKELTQAEWQQVVASVETV